VLVVYCDIYIVDFLALFFLDSKVCGWLYIVKFVKCLFDVRFVLVICYVF
jgi:hypothetical protein